MDDLTASGALNLVGLVFQFVGIGLAAIGLWNTWHEYGPADEVFLAPLLRALAATRRRVVRTVDAIRRALGRPRRQVITGVGGIASGAAFGTARVRAQFRILPTELDIAEAISELDDRTRRLSTTIADTADRIDHDVQTVRGSVGQLQDRLTNEIERLDQLTRHIAAGGARLEAAGLFIIAIGTMLQVVGTLVA